MTAPLDIKPRGLKVAAFHGACDHCTNPIVAGTTEIFPCWSCTTGKHFVCCLPLAPTPAPTEFSTLELDLEMNDMSAEIDPIDPGPKYRIHYDEPTSMWLDVGPEFAELLIGHNTHNRNLRKRYVNQLAGAMKRGEWHVTGDAFKVAKDGTLLDGQHRGAAIIQSGVTIRSLVVFGLERPAQDYMDMNLKRTVADTLGLKGEVSTTQLGAVLTMFYRWQNQAIQNKVTITPPTKQQLAELLEANPDLRDAVRIGGAIRAKVPLPPSPAILSYFLITRADRDRGIEFFNSVMSGLMLNETSPVYRLRTRLFDLRNDRGSRSSDEYLALVIKTWNAYVLGREMKVLSYKDTDTFPVPLTPDQYLDEVE